jgi:phospholipase/carboxylesterase
VRGGAFFIVLDFCGKYKGPVCPQAASTVAIKNKIEPFFMANNLERIVIQPSQKPIGSVIWLHGLGADAYDFANIAQELHLPDELPLRFVLPHAPIRPVTVNQNNPTRAWYDVYSFNDLNQEDAPGILQMQTLIEQLIEEEIAEGIDSKRIILAGFSQGGAMALRTALCHSRPLGGVLALSTYLPLPHQLQQDSQALPRSLPVFIGHGLFDHVLPVMLGLACYKQLRDLGYPSVEWHDYPMEHQLCEQELQDIARWIVKQYEHNSLLLKESC